MVKSYTQLVTQLNKATNIAVKNTCNRLLGTLQQLILSEFYDKFTPEYYQRTYQFLDSAITKMVSSNIGKIMMDADKMRYGDFWNGEKQLYAANIGSHGGYEITEGHFWDSFIEYCEQNAKNILKEELIKQKVPIK